MTRLATVNQGPGGSYVPLLCLDGNNIRVAINSLQNLCNTGELLFSFQTAQMENCGLGELSFR